MRYLAALVLLGLCAALVRSNDRNGNQGIVVTSRSMPGEQTAGKLVVRLVFGLADTEPTDWSGSIVADNGRAPALEGWRFLMADRIGAEGSWDARSRLGPVTPTPVGQPGGLPVEPARQAPQPVGITCTMDLPAPRTLRIRTMQGDFEFDPSRLTPGESDTVLNGRVRIERLPYALAASEGEAHADYPAGAADREGGCWTVWVAYADRKENVLCRRYDGNGWSAPETVTPKAGDFYRPAAAVDGKNRLWIVWSAREGDNWDLWARRRDLSGWAPPERLTSAPGPDIEAHLASAPDGTLLLIWQGFRKGQAEILARRHDGTRWGQQERLSDGVANNWDPAVAVDSRGNFAAAWDTYVNGCYQIRLRLFQKGAWGPVRAVTSGPQFAAHASLAYGPNDSLWIAWDESGQNWGKDTGFLIRSGATRLYQGRKIRIATLPAPSASTPDTPLRLPEKEIQAVLPESSVAVCELPQLVFDRSGRLWTLFRRRTAKIPRRDGWAAGGFWEIYATRCGSGSWTTPVALPHSSGRNDMRVAFVTDSRMGTLVAWASDNRTWQAPAPRQHKVYVGRLEELPGSVSSGSPAAGGPLPPAPAADRRVHPDESADVARIRAYRITANGKHYRILRGDLHRHTEQSSDGAGDGSLLDFYRYGLDAAGFDYILVTDHNDGGDAEYPWWRREKSNDLYYLAGRFVPLYGYERSVPYPNGHRNVLFAHRGVRTLPISPAENRGEKDTGPILYPYLRANQGLCTSHTSATSQGTDWRNNDPALEPMVELFQGYHTSYEYPGAPRAVNEKTGLIHGAYEPAGFVWSALKKGYRLGFQASSDHISTHVSYSCVLAQNMTREGILHAFRQRHCYAATDNIVLDVRMGEHIMGDEFTARSLPPLEIHAIGTGPLAEVVVVRDEQIVYTAKPDRQEVRLRYTDMESGAGSHRYYVRVQQQDGQLAWASPIWVNLN